MNINEEVSVRGASISAATAIRGTPPETTVSVVLLSVAALKVESPRRSR